ERQLLGQQVPDYSNLVLPSSLQALCRYMETTLKVHEKAMIFTIEKEVFGFEHQTFVLIEDITQFAAMDEIGATMVAVYMRCLFDVLKTANMVNIVGFVDPAQVSANSGSLTQRSRLLANRLQKTDGEQIFFMPYNPSRHWILLIVRAKRETVYFLDPLPENRVVDEEAKNIVNSAIKIYNSHIARAGRTPKQPSSVGCGYYVMRFMRDIIMDPSLAFEKK
ncbi:PREDICTED: ubiquitin-like-specific protease, partial [Prunus dulcis]